MNPKKIAVVTVRPLNGEIGGAERLYDGLVNILNTLGMNVEYVSLVSDESCFDAIQETYLRFYDLDLSRYDGVISTKAPSYLIRHPKHICYLVHTMRVFYDMFEHEFPQPWDELKQQRAFIQRLDTKALEYPRIKKIFTIGHEVTRRLSQYNRLESEILHPGLSIDQFYIGDMHNYLFLPGRLHRWKRVDLVIEAMQYVTRDILLKIAGTGEDEMIFREKAAHDPRVEFLGRVSDQDLVDLYAHALAVPFVPLREDYGYITLEAFRSGKPVITCTDAGEPMHFVKDGETGFICPPEPQAIARKIEWLYDHPETAADMGRKGFASIRHITWENVGKRLIEELCRA